MIVISKLVIINISAIKLSQANNIFNVFDIPTKYLPKTEVKGNAVFNGANYCTTGYLSLLTSGVVTAITNNIGNINDYTDNNLYGSIIYAL